MHVCRSQCRSEEYHDPLNKLQNRLPNQTNSLGSKNKMHSKVTVKYVELMAVRKQLY